MNTLLTSIPPLPSFGKLRLYLVLSTALGITAFSLPVRLTLAFSGGISSNGPTTTLESTTDGTIASLPPENKLLERNVLLFSFKQPVLAADLEVLRVQESGLARRLAEAQIQCGTLMKNSKRKLKNTRETYALYAQAYTQKAISKVTLLSYRDAIDAAELQVEVQNAQCLRDSSALSNELEVTREQIVKQKSATQFQQELRAPDRGSVYGLTVKPGQRVVRGEILGQFTSLGSTGAQLLIPIQDRPFIAVGDRYKVLSKAYAFIVDPPQYKCKIASITPDVVVERNGTKPVSMPMFQALCQFEQSPLKGTYPLLVGMPVDAYGTSTNASLMQLLLRGYRNLVTPKPPAQESSSLS